MRLYLVRHAEAALGELAERLRDDGVEPDAIITSPLLRARETGEALAEATGVGAQSDERLAPGATEEDVRAAVPGCGVRQSRSMRRGRRRTRTSRRRRGPRR